MTKEDLVKEFNRLIEAHYSEEIDSRDEWVREIIWLKNEVIKKLTVPTVVRQNEQLKSFLDYCDEAGWIKNIDKNRIIKDYTKSL